VTPEPTTSHRTATAKQVAAVAGVHPSTVSRSLDPLRAALVREETRRRVIAAANKLNYRPDMIASGLRRQRTHTIGVLVPDLGNPVFAAFIRGISRRLERAGFTAIVVETEDQHGRLETGARLFSERRVDAVISGATRSGDRRTLRQLVRSGVPVIMAMRWIRGLEVPIVANDDLRGGVLAAEHLLSLGHRRLAQLHGPDDIETFRERGLGFHGTVARAGIDDAEQVRYAKVPVAAEGHKLMRSLLRTGGEPPSGVFAHNDLMAVGAIEALKEASLRCPEDVSVVGYNDMPLTEHLAPPLTTVRLPAAEIGRVAAETLLSELDDDGRPPVSISLQPRLVVRRSTAPPR
jgi:LacI family transcriptional regulator